MNQFESELLLRVLVSMVYCIQYIYTMQGREGGGH